LPFLTGMAAIMILWEDFRIEAPFMYTVFFNAWIPCILLFAATILLKILWKSEFEQFQ
jgi:hypothetical protein